MSLLDRIRSRSDGDAWEVFFHRYGGLIWWFARRFGLGVQDSKDIVQEVMFELVEKVSSFEYDPAKGRFRGMLKTITRRRVIDRVRKRQPTSTDQALLHELESGSAWSGEWERQELRLKLLRALELVRREVDPKTYQAFDLYFLQGQPAMSVAKFLKMKRDSVYAAKSRVLERLRQRLASDEEEPMP